MASMAAVDRVDIVDNMAWNGFHNLVSLSSCKVFWNFLFVSIDTYVEEIGLYTNNKSGKCLHKEAVFSIQTTY